MQTCMSKNVVNCNSVTVELPSCSLPLALIHVLASDNSVAPIREIARYKLFYVSTVTSKQPEIYFVD